MKRTRGRAVRGTRAVRVVQGRRGTNFTMKFAVSNISGLVHHELSEGGMTGERFVHFLQTVYTNHRANAAVSIVDNAAAHRPAANVQLPDDYGLCFLPPYSPFLNICENAFAIWKTEIKTTLAEVRHELLTQPHQQRMVLWRSWPSRASMLLQRRKCRQRLGGCKDTSLHALAEKTFSCKMFE